MLLNTGIGNLDYPHIAVLETWSVDHVYIIF